MENKLNKRIEMILDNLDVFADCGGVVHDITGQKFPISGKAFCRLCAACVQHPKAGNFCRHNATSGAYQAMISGQIHYSKCWLGLYNLIAPISPDGKNIIGALEIGGLLPPGMLQDIQHHIITTLSAIDNQKNLPRFINALQGLEEMPSINIDNLKSFTREAMFSSGLLNAKVFETNAAMWNQQSRLANAATHIKDLSLFKRRDNIFKSSNLILEIINTGDTSNLQAELDNILSLAVTGEPNDLKSVKAFLLPVISAISMNDLLCQQKWSRVMRQHTLRIDEMADIDNQQELCFWFESTIMNIWEKANKEVKEESLSEKVKTYLHQHFQENIKLEETSKSIGASTSSIMHKLKKETGKTFSQHLNSIRIKEAKRLLTFTSLSLGEISIRCGFKDQSYFTKVFTKNINIGPREFKNMLIQESQ